MSVPPYFMSRWVKQLLSANKTILTVSVELSENEAERLLNANANLVRLNPVAFLSEVECDVLCIDERFLEKVVEKFGLKPIIEKLCDVVKVLPRTLPYLTLRFEHCSPKDVAYHLFDVIVPDVPGVTLTPSGQAFACHRSRMDLLLVLSLLSERVLVMDREYGALKYRYIHLRPMVSIFDVEWRLFYIDNRLVAVTQYYTNVPHKLGKYVYSVNNEEVEDIISGVIKSAEEARKMLGDVLQELRNYVIDVAALSVPGKIEHEGRAQYIKSTSYPIVDVNPLILETREEMFAAGTYTGLFTLSELKKLAEEDRDHVVVRYVAGGGVRELRVRA